MAASTGQESLFATALSGVFDSWTVLQLAVSHGFGGAESEEKAEWMVYATEQWFKENKNIEPHEVEDFLADVMNAEFDTIVEDGSLSQIATLICGFHRLYSDGNEAEIKERLQRLPKAATVQSSRAHPVDDDDDDSEEDDNAASASSSSHMDALHHHQGQQSQAPQNRSTSPNSQNVEDMETEQAEEEEGWHVVRRGKKR